MNDFQRVLLLGTGPASIQLAVTCKRLWQSRVAIAGRESVRSAAIFEALHHGGSLGIASVQNEKHRAMEGECAFDAVFRGYELVRGVWDTLILAVTADAYLDVLKRLPPSVLREAKLLVLVSPTFGSNRLVHRYMQDIRPDAEVVSFSTYYGDTRWAGGEPSNRVLTAAVKRKVYLGSTAARSDNVRRLQAGFEQLGIATEALHSPLAAESRNISLYVHPPLFMNAFALQAIFEPGDVPKYVYKLFPEGPITPSLIGDMLAQWSEMMGIVDRLHLPRLNLLKFMIDDNYPVRPESLPRAEIERFERLAPIHQAYLLYVRYASLMIDPFSEPDREGRYYDFSAVPIRPVFVNKEGCLDIPRMPKEDYYRIKIIQGIARHLGADCPTIDRFIYTYEEALRRASDVRQHMPLSEAFVVQTFEEDIKRICDNWEVFA
ncbi:opine metallophore biosynthesis dehydrogenase [Paenibacillus xanthanilyticus]|uniref:Opine metallophore biosynthesis dehydrogenase n=1 Tax=Paenibacillus xanthanilyticus TaxID=1783531 RepID=A0ABV8K0W5_9BACL